MRHLTKFNESIGSTNRVLLVTGGDDFHALSFEQEHGGVLVKDIIDDLQFQHTRNRTSKYESDGWELEVFEFGEIDPEFVKFIKSHIQDYDHSKNTNFYLENQTIGR